jgi:peptidyl-prolyl cis-trans isomerase D
MLQAIRDKAQGWIAWTIVILIIIPFALFGLDQYGAMDRSAPKAEVNGAEISQIEFERLYTRQRQMLQERLGDMYDSLVIDADLRQRVLDSLIEQKLLQGHVQDAGYRISDAQLQAMIQSQSLFHENGRFSQAKYEQLLRANGLSAQGFENLQRESLAVSQFERGVMQTVFSPEPVLTHLEEITGQERKMSHALISLSQALDGLSISQEQAQARYAENAQDYQRPEQVKLAYIQLTPDELTKDLTMSDETLEAFYAQNIVEFTRPEERRARHILIDLAQEETARDTLEKLRAGADFAQLAQTLSKDPGSAAQGGDLGYFSAGVMVPEFEKATFSLALNGLSDLVKTQFGYHIIQVTDIKAPQVLAFDQVKSQVLQMYKTEQASARYFDLSERLANAAYEQNTSLAPAAELLGLAVQTTDWMPRTAMTGLFSSPKVREAAFSEALYQQGLNSELITLGTNQALVFRVEAKMPASQLPFEAVKTQIVQQLQNEQARAQLEQLGEQTLKNLQGGADMDRLAMQQGWLLTESVWSDRENFMVPPEVRDTAFTLPQGVLPSYGQVWMPNGDLALVRLEEVRAGEALTAEQKVAFAKAYADLMADFEMKALLAEMKARAKITRAP